MALDEDFYGEDFNALCTIKIQFKYGENILVLKSTVYIFKYMVIISIQLNQRIGKKNGEEHNAWSHLGQQRLSTEFQGLLQQIINKSAQQYC